ncbi:DUF4097 family beta strand repeat-containing protein [Actinomadura harenae]|uniref:Adhesin domain-containing protein n=1 Tax=Actinomadura harenae TaxID=2483351 RepID=A0A3M2MA49_9ACTN|nr:DUF4097 family beta strand repeat-containing protein [Actinomadura harenae]RMI46352.1 hypothetical protein EBO15_07240 [Actinomadura harenae]
MTVTGEPPTATPDAPDAPGRPRRRGPWLGLAALTALCVAVPTALEVAGVQLQHTAETSEELPQHPIRKVEVDATSASVTVQAGTSEVTRLSQSLHWVMAKPRVRTEWNGDTLKLKVSCGDGGLGTFNLCDADVTLSVPRGVAVRGRMTSGTLSVRGTNGGADLQNNSGTLELADVSGPLRAWVSSGSVRGERLSADTVDTASGSGSIELAFAVAPTRVVARTGSGSVEIGVPRGSHYAVSGSTNSGSRDIAQGISDGTSANRLDLSSGSGAVSVHY